MFRRILTKQKILRCLIIWTWHEQYFNVLISIFGTGSHNIMYELILIFQWGRNQENKYVSEGTGRIRLSNATHFRDLSWYQALLNKFKDISNYRPSFQSPRSDGENEWYWRGDRSHIWVSHWYISSLLCSLSVQLPWSEIAWLFLFEWENLSEQFVYL